MGSSPGKHREHGQPLVLAPGVWTDGPIRRPADDLFEMDRIAKAIALRIDACTPGQDSVVFGLVGRWGSGKSTVIEFVRQRMPNTWLISDFTPWATPESQGLEYEFLASLLSALDKGESKDAGRAKKALLKYGPSILPLATLIPIAGKAVEGIAKAQFDKMSRQEPWKSVFDTLSKVLQKIPERVLILADDVDRLDAHELLRFLKVVRLLGRLPNVHYLVAYDDTTVESLLKPLGLAAGASPYVDKFVQHPFILPPLSDLARRKTTEETVKQVLRTKDARLPEELHQQRAAELVGLLSDLLRTPREHLRFREAVLAEVSLVDVRDIDVLDFIAVSYLRTAQRRAYAGLEGWRQHLTPNIVRTWADGDATTPVDNIVEAVRKSANPGTAQGLERLISFLLPNFSTQRLTYNVTHERAYSDSAYSHRYVWLGVAADDLADSVVEGSIQRLMDPDAPTGPLDEVVAAITSGDRDLAALAFERLRHARRGAGSTSGELLHFALGHAERVIQGEVDYGLGNSEAFRFASHELALAVEGSFATPSTIETRYGHSVVLPLLRNMHRDDRGCQALIEFSRFYRQLVENDPATLLHGGASLPFVLEMIETIEPGELGEGHLGIFIGDDLQLYLNVATAFVVVERWVGADEDELNLKFKTTEFTHAVGQETIQRFADQLADGPSLDAVTADDVSDENRAVYARAHAKSLGVEKRD